jgi:hypothetical protein
VFGIFVGYYNIGKFIARMKRLDEKYMNKQTKSETVNKKK